MFMIEGGLSRVKGKCMVWGTLSAGMWATHGEEADTQGGCQGYFYHFNLGNVDHIMMD